MAFSRIADSLKSKPNSKTGDQSRFISDQRFSDQLNQVHKLKQFLFEEKVRFNPKQLGSIDLGPLNRLRYGAFGRLPTDKEWKLLDEKLSALASYLDSDLRRKIRIRELSRFLGSIPLVFLLVAVGSTVFYSLYPRFIPTNTLSYDVAFIVSVTVWTISQGGLGACAFLGTRIAIQKVQGIKNAELLKEPADITDISVLKTRIIQGLLFAFLIGLPVSFQALDRIWKSLFQANYSVSALDMAMILIPFLFGFSTNLVLVILDRSVTSIQTFFGLPSSKQ